MGQSHHRSSCNLVTVSASKRLRISLAGTGAELMASDKVREAYLGG